MENIRLAEANLPVPLALERIAALVERPGAELDEAAFLTEVLEATSALLLLDLATLYASSRNHGVNPLDFLDRLPLERLTYVHCHQEPSADRWVTHGAADTQAKSKPLLKTSCTKLTSPAGTHIQSASACGRTQDVDDIGFIQFGML